MELSYHQLTMAINMGAGKKGREEGRKEGNKERERKKKSQALVAHTYNSPLSFSWFYGTHNMDLTES
jgi:hypothetical protein